MRAGFVSERSTSGITINRARRKRQVRELRALTKTHFQDSPFCEPIPRRGAHESAVNNNPNRFLRHARHAVGNDSPTTMIPTDAGNNFKPNRTPETSGSGLFAYRPENPAPSAIRSHPLDIRWPRAARSRARARARIYPYAHIHIASRTVRFW